MTSRPSTGGRFLRDPDTGALRPDPEAGQPEATAPADAPASDDTIPTPEPARAAPRRK
ncbi:MAG: hypothetical protein ACK46Q_07430 [Hyphomonas sp.]